MAGVQGKVLTVLVLLAIVLTMASFGFYNFVKIPTACGPSIQNWPFACYPSEDEVKDTTCLSVEPHPFGCQSLDFAVIVLIVTVILAGSFAIYKAYSPESLD